MYIARLFSQQERDTKSIQKHWLKRIYSIHTFVIQNSNMNCYTKSNNHYYGNAIQNEQSFILPPFFSIQFHDFIYIEISLDVQKLQFNKKRGITYMKYIHNIYCQPVFVQIINNCTRKSLSYTIAYGSVCGYM